MGQTQTLLRRQLLSSAQKIALTQQSLAHSRQPSVVAEQSAQRTLRHRFTVSAPRLLLVADVVDAGDGSRAVLDRLIASDVRRAQNGNLAIEGLTLPDGDDGLAGGV